MASYYNPNPYAGMGFSGSYAAQNGNYMPNPYNYTPAQNFAPAQPPIAVQTQSQPQPQPQPQNNGSPFVMVPSREAAKDIAVSPNQTVYAMSQNAPEFYVKSADNMGLVTTRYFKFGEFDPAVEAAQMQAQAQAKQNVPTSDFVPRSEFNQVVNQLSEQLNSVRQSLSNAPQNAIINEPAPTSKSTSKKNKENTND